MSKSPPKQTSVSVPPDLPGEKELEAASLKFTNEARAKGIDLMPAKRHGNHAAKVYEVDESHLQSLSVASARPKVNGWMTTFLGGAIGAAPAALHQIFDFFATTPKYNTIDFISLLICMICVGGVIISALTKPKKTEKNVDDICDDIRKLPEK